MAAGADHLLLRRAGVGYRRDFGFIPSFAVTDAAEHGGLQLGKLLDPATPSYLSRVKS